MVVVAVVVVVVVAVVIVVVVVVVLTDHDIWTTHSQVSFELLHQGFCTTRRASLHCIPAPGHIDCFRHRTRTGTRSLTRTFGF